MAILRFVVFYRPKYFSKCAVSGCDFEIYVKKEITEESEESRDSGILCVLHEDLFVFVCD